MISINGNNILSAYTGGIPVQAIYCYGNKVWPTTEPELSYYYMSWTPTNISAQGYISGQNVYLSKYDGYYSWSKKDDKGFYYQTFIGSGTELSIDYFETNVTAIYNYHYNGDTLNNSNPFWGDVNISSVYLPKCSILGGAVFIGMKIQHLSLPECTKMTSPEGGGQTCAGNLITELYLPKCSYLCESAFQNCSKLTTVSLPECTYLSFNCFTKCSKLQSISLPKCSYIGNCVFSGCSSLSTITLGYSSVCYLAGSSVFFSCSALVSVLVPESLVSKYKQNNYWSFARSIIFAIP